MSTKKVNTQTNQYNQASMGAYNALMPQTASMLQSYMNNPMGVVSPFYNLATQQAVRSANAAGTARMGNITGNMAALGAPNANLAAYKQSQINAGARANTANTANAFLQGNLGKAQAALGVQQAGLSGALNFRPLQTGTTQTETQSGLGTWLPQVIGGAAGMAMNAFMPGAGAMANLGGNFGNNAGATPFMAPRDYSGYAGAAPPDPGFGAAPPPSYWAQFGGQG